MNNSSNGYRAGVDIGGTFTDVVVTGSKGLKAVKIPTAPSDRAGSVLTGIKSATRLMGIGLDDIASIVHGSTTGTNALIERSGARTGFLTTRGFRDILEIGRMQRPMEGLYDFTVDRPKPLVPRYLCLEVAERMDARGTVLQPLDEESVVSAASVFAEHDVEAVAVCLLFAHLNPNHENRVAKILEDCLPGRPVSLSSRISPEYREYERASTTVMNAYLTPVMTGYLASLERRIAAEVPNARLAVIQANGGSTSIEQAHQRAVSTVNSGPCGGVVAGAFYGRRHGRKNLVSVDMGGTSFDIGLIEDGHSRITTEGEFQRLPVKVPVIDLHIIGAGGGSIAWIDSGGALNVGPGSAGAEPGPVCYGRGGQLPTVTDANLVLGRLGPDNFNAGNMVLDTDAARRSIDDLAAEMRTELEDAAMGIIRVVNANMTRGIATVTIQRGIDVREFALMSFGGAGGTHAVELALELSMSEVIVPPLPGTFSAVGLLTTEMRHDYVTPIQGLRTSDADPDWMETIFREMETNGKTDLTQQGYVPRSMRLTRLADMKVVGQTYELLLSLPDQGPVTRAGIDSLVAAFERLYRERYAFFFEGEHVEFVNLRVTAEGLNPSIRFPEGDAGPVDPKQAQSGQRPVYFEGTGWTQTSVYDRNQLAGGMRVPGPAIIEEETSTTLVPPAAAGEVLPDLGLVITMAQPGGRDA